MKNLITLITLLSCMCASICRAEVSVTSELWSKYFTSSTMLHEDPVLQTSISGPLGESFSWSVFHSMDLQDPTSSESFGNEVDYTISFEKSLGAESPWSIGADLSYWDLVSLFDASADVLVGTVWISKSLSDNWSATLSIDRLISTKKDVYDGGTYVTFGFDGLLPIKEQVSLALTPALTYDDGVFDLAPAWFVQLTVSLEWKVGKLTIHLPKFDGTKMLSSVDDRGSETRWGASVSFDF